MQKQTLRLRKRSASRFLFPLASTGLALFFLFVIFPLVPEIKLASATIDNTVYGLELATNPSINLSIQPTAAGAVSVAKDTVTANTNSPSGYKLYLSVNKDLDNNIYLNGDESNNSASTKFIPTTGTYESPSTLSQNSWGYAVAGLNNFDVTYNTTTPSISSKFANLPTANNEQLIHDHSGVATDDTTDIYYGVKADINIASGNYSTELLYTTISDASSEVNGEATITPSQVNDGYTATELTITTSLVTNKNLGTISAMIGNVACEDIELVTNNPVTITCTLPAGLVGGKYNVVLNIPNLGKTYTIVDGLTVHPKSMVTVNFAGVGVNRVTIATQNQPTQTITTSGQTAQLEYDTSYTITASFTTGNEFQSWSTTSGVLGQTSSNPTTFKTTSNSTLTITGKSSCEGVVDSDGVCVTTMQEMNAGVCAAMPLGQQFQLKDVRDNKYYWIARLADGNCWMTQNLNYNLSVAANQTLRPATSNVTSNRTLVPITYDPQSDSDYENVYYQNAGNYYLPNGKGTKTSTNCTVRGNENCHYELGGYYSWYAVTAGKGTQGVSELASVTESVCPAGWELPTQGYHDVLGYQKLLSAYNIRTGDNTSDAALLSAPLYFVRSGMYYSSDPWEIGEHGKFWTATASGILDAYLLDFSATNVNPSSTHYRTMTKPTRCVSSNYYIIEYDANGGTNAPATQKIKTPASATVSSAYPTYSGKLFAGWATTSNATTAEYSGGEVISMPSYRLRLYAVWVDGIAMQDIAQYKSLMVLEQQYQMVDQRDGKMYWVAKLQDGNIWMTQNLDYDIVMGNNIMSKQDGTTITWNVTNSSDVTKNAAGGSIANSYNPGDYYLENGTSTQKSIQCTIQNNGGENCHYQIGNFYRYFTAIRGGTNADDASVCPKGWRVPNGDNQSQYGFRQLTNTYGITYNWSNGSEGSYTKLLSAPIYMTLVGYYSTEGNRTFTGSRGYYWNTDSAGATFWYTDWIVKVSEASAYENGFSIRCVAI